MALASRILFRSRQIYASQAVFSRDNDISVRTFAKKALSNGPPSNEPPSLKGDEMLKEIFLDVKKKYDIAWSVLKREKITIDPDDPAAVAQFAKVMKTIRQETGLPSESELMKKRIIEGTKDIPDVRSYLIKLSEIRKQMGLVDEIGIEAQLLRCLNVVEGVIKKPVLRDNKNHMALVKILWDRENKRLGVPSSKDLPKWNEQYELKSAKVYLEDLKQHIIENMETYLKREEFKGAEMPDIRSIDIRDGL